MKPLAILIALVLVAPAQAQSYCPGGNCSRPMDYGWQSAQQWAPAQEFNAGQRMVTIDQQPQGPVDGHCRINVTGYGSMGSGTLVYKDAEHGLVMTCSHLFDDAQGRIIVTFRDGSRFGANLVERDRANDLALLKIMAPRAEPITPYDGEPSGVIAAGGFGNNGQFRQIAGRIVGSATPVGAQYKSSIIEGSVRPGDSGGGAFCNGRFVGVVWGARDGQTYITCGEPVRRLLSARLAMAAKPPVTLAQYGSAGGGYYPPSQPPGYPPTGPPTGPDEPIRECDCADRWAELDARLTSIENNLKFQADSYTSLTQYIDQRIEDAGAGEPGPPGPAGPSGKDGKPADIDLIADDVAKKLPPFWLRLVDENKQPRTEYAEIHLGNRQTLRLIPNCHQ